MRRRPVRLSGFTLVELLVVIGIIALLISILLPVLGRARDSARSIQCLSNLRQFYMADAMYLSRFKGWHMPGATGSAMTSSGTLAKDGSDFWSSMEELRRTLQIAYLPNKGAAAQAWAGYLPKERLCPDMVRGWNDLHTADALSGWKDMYVNYSYGMNIDGADYGNGAADVVYNIAKAPQADWNLNNPVVNPGHMSFHGFKNSQVKRGAEKILFADAMFWFVNEWGSGVQPGWKGQVSTYDRVGERPHSTAAGNGNLPDGASFNSERTVAWRHGKKTLANIVFFDGHGESVSKDRFVTKDSTGNVIPNYRMWRVLE
jgi:prepilin-type N-terminal cleavage/methylation domain-containing protein/prepilin-type processing-associated H-X9-DG protein